MTISEALSDVRYVTDASGQRTDVVVPLKTWKVLLASWKQLIARLEDHEDQAILQEWLAKRASGEAETISLGELERELIADGLLAG